MRNRHNNDDERNRGELSAGPFGRRPDGSLGGDYARDTHRGGFGDDYARDTGWSGGGAHDDYTPPPRWDGPAAPAPLGRVSHRGRGPKNWRRSDERIREEMNERLTYHDGVDATDIEVAVENGEVTLTGQVTSRWEKRLAEDVADMVQGVRDVHNRLTVSERDAHIGKASE
ncbi:MAG: hypothetical protein QOH21_2383 [Acidobacteriota bacterium]|jgi:hypothetical protein|nr:hypothetical protein [Acidobacteriota bacterium]